MPAKKPSRTVQIYKEAREFVDQLLRERNTTLDELIKAGRLEHALFMMWASVKNILYRGMVPGSEFKFLDDYLEEKGIDLSKISQDAKIELTYGDLQDIVKRTRKWAWSLRQSVIPIRGRALEKIVRLVIGDALGHAFAEMPKISMSTMDTSGKRKYNNVDYTVFLSSGLQRRVVMGFSVKGNIRERKDESVDTRRRALESGSHDQVWHIFLSEGGPGDMDAFQQMEPSEDGQVYTWRGIAQQLKKPGIKAISELPKDLLTYVKPKLGV